MTIIGTARRGCGLLLLGISASAALALVPKQVVTPLDDRVFFRPELYISISHLPTEPASLGPVRAAAWQRFGAETDDDFQIVLDPRSGVPSNVIARLPLLPGNGLGNQVTLSEVGARIGRAVAVIDEATVEESVRSVVAAHRDALAINPQQLGGGRARRVADDLWHVTLEQRVGGVPVRYAKLVAAISHGNLVLLGTEAWGHVNVDTQPTLTSEEAVALGFDHIGGKIAEDEFWMKPQLEILPYSRLELQEGDAYTGPIGQGYGHRLVWAFGFHRQPDLSSWELIVDAHSGEVLSFEDRNQYQQEKIAGGIYPLTSTEICPTNDTCGTMETDYPMPWANTGQPVPNNYTNSAGLYDFLGGNTTTTLNGRYVRVTDTCGAISETTTDGSLDLGGTNGQHNCTTGLTSAGNTPASRSCFYEINKLAEMARGWLPNNTWLQGQVVSNVNLNQTCNAFYSPGNGTVNFYKTGGGCRNTGEIAAVFDHEWGHAIDDNDSGGALSSSSEAYADIVAIYRLQTSCVGHGFFHTSDRGCGNTADGTGFNANEANNGSHCDVDCSGVRDADWAKHSNPLPDTPTNYNCSACSSGSGPCGRQVHCSAAPARQAAWDFVVRDLQREPFNYDENTAFLIGNKVFYQGSGAIASWHGCSCTAGTSDGCGATNAYMQWLAADDDNGNVNDGTPHMTALFDAFNRHGIACATPTPQNSGCAGGPTAYPLVTITGGNNSLGLQWTAVPGAVGYRVLRTEGFAGCAFGKTLIATVPGTSYSDPDVANGREYSYVVQAVGVSGACFGPASPCVTAAPQPCSGSVAIAGSVFNCSDSVEITLVDSDLTGAGTHPVQVSSDTEPTPESVSLVEAPPNSGRFTGSIQATSAAAASGDGLISVSDGDSVDVGYLDISSCGTPNVQVQSTRPVDCAGPAITGVDALDVTGTSARIVWNTNEVASSSVLFDTVNPPVAGTNDTATLVTGHNVTLGGLDECTTYYYAVSSTDQADNSSTANAGGNYYSFETGTNNTPSVPSVGPAVPIPDNSPTAAVKTIEIPFDETIVDVEVTVNITHTEDGDLSLRLIGPDGTNVMLSNRHGGTGNHYTNTRFDDEAAQPITSGSPPFSGTFRPDTPLTAFDTKNAQGTWTFRVEDHNGTDSGTIDSWSIHFIFAAEPCGPSLRYLSYAATETCSSGGSGDGNDAIESGELVTIPVTIKNDGIGAVTGITAQLASPTAGVTVLADLASFPDLQPGESAAAPYSFIIDSNVPCGTTIDFSLEAAANEGSWTDNFEVGTGIPTFQINPLDSLDVPHNLPDNGLQTSVLPVSAVGSVTDVDVLLSVTHENDADLDITLVAPNGLRIELTSDNGGAEDNYDSTRFDDEASTPITNGAAPFTGSFQPEQLLSTLDGLGAAGNWILEVRDDAANSTGKLRAWGLILTTPSGPICNGCSQFAPTDEVASLQWSPGSTTSLEWSPVTGAQFYSVFRGDRSTLPALLDASVDSCLVDAATALTTGERLIEPPPADGLQWFLVRAGTSGGLGPAGQATDGPRVQNSSGPCP